MEELQPTAVIAMTGIRILPGTGMVDIALRDGQIDDDDNLLHPKFYVARARSATTDRAHRALRAGALELDRSGQGHQDERRRCCSGSAIARSRDSSGACCADLVVTRTKIHELARIIRRFSRVRLLVVGDLMLDHFVMGKVDRISPEAPVPVVTVSRESFHLGGAANVAANVRALGGRATIVGVIGRDETGRHILDELKHIGVGVGGMLATSSLPTTRKTRIVAHQQQVVRLDYEARITDSKLDRRVRDRVQRLLSRFDGVWSPTTARASSRPPCWPTSRRDARTAAAASSIRRRANFPNYRNATLVKPNLDAAQAASGVDVHDDASLRPAGRGSSKRGARRPC